MAKIALVTDTHWGVRNDSIAFANYFKKFYDNIFFPYLIEHDICHVIHLGDIVDRRKFINFNSANRLKEDFIIPLYENSIEAYMIVGNHDAFYKNTLEINSMRELYGNRSYPNLNIIDKPTEITIDDTNIVLMPWMCQDNMNDALNLIQSTKSEILFGHLELAGFEMNKGTVIDHGMDTNVFGKFDVVCSGHYHHRSSKGNINYLGCPYEITWSDYADPKGFHIFDTETRGLTFISNPYTMFNKIHYDDSKWSSIDQVFDFSDLTGTYVKVIVREKTNPYWFDVFIDKLEKFDPLNIQVVDDNLYLNLEDDIDIVSEAEDTLTILKKFIDTAEGADKTEIDKVLSELYLEASSI